MRFSRYTRRAKRYGSARILSRLAARLAPTPYQSARALKQEVRQELRARNPDYRDGLASFQTKWAAKGLGPLDPARAVQLYGRGGYWGRTIGGYLGGALGSLVGNNRMKDLGASLGDRAGDFVSDRMHPAAVAAARVGQYLVGGGGYHMAGAGSDDMDMAAPQVGSFAEGEVDSVRVKRREYLGAIAGSDALVLRSLVLNAGDPGTFPRLSRMAMNYEQYKMHGLVFWFKSTSGESTNSANTNIGEIIMCSVSDPAEPNPTNKQQLVETDGSVQAKPSISSCYGVECADVPVLKVRHGDPNESTDSATLYDVGKFFIGIEGANVATTRVGELWVTYDVSLIRARDPRGLDTIGFKAYFPNVPQADLFTCIAPAVPTVLLNSLRVVLSSGNKITFPQFLNEGTFVIAMKAIGQPAVSPCQIVQFGPTISSVSRCVVLEQRVDRLASATVSAGNYSEGVTFCWYVVRINSPDSTQASLTFDSSMNWQSAVPSYFTMNGPLEIDIYRVPDVGY